MPTPVQEPFPPLTFDGPLLVVGGSAFAPRLLSELAPRAVGIVGADSGADAIVAAGLVPDAVIGDMDSVADPKGFGPHTRIVALAEQQTTDFEKCLYSTRAPVTLAVGMTGGRFDHTLAALHAIARYAEERRIILIDEHDLALGVSGSIRLRVGVDQRVSIYPLGRTQFSGSRGLAYPLDGLVMEQGRFIGTSNASIADEIEISVAPGKQSPWLLILERSLLPRLL
ncbi:thiamine diphosphokinase [Pelagibacterium lentulum]|uniref:Thiamine diphosphokinase n=1 Tax=Pelagibacterium lentulum TaxID=2029865 RepID=A0A916RHV9_9HYPH|nr:thiamine diphosphokinase [Pelagibacterium lentulum]GGA57743.1 thiamine pyrophosphokinase [Pelagibacterium lentulum]